MTRHYERCEIVCFEELTEEQKSNLDCDEDYIKEGLFVVFEGVPLFLGNFMRCEHSKIWDGVYGTSYFSAYWIKIKGDCAVVADRYF